MWELFLLLASICLVGSVIFAAIRWKAKYKSGRFFNPLRILTAGVGLAAAFLFIPLYLNELKGTSCNWFETLLMSIHNMIRLFLVDGEFSIVTNNLGEMAAWVEKCYTVVFSVLFVSAPILTFGFVLSFFKNAFAYVSFFFHFCSNVFIFSELNERSLALAESLSKNKKEKRFFIFTDVFEQEEEKCYEMIEKARELRAVCFKKDIVTIKFTFHSRKKSMNFFAIGEDQSENMNQALDIIEKMRYRDNTNLYVFSTRVEAEVLLTKAFRGGDPKKGDTKIKVRRVNEVQSLISRNLYEFGYENIFKSAYDENGIKKINAVVVGMGKHGTEMTKALAWFCQMDGYQVSINAFDAFPNARDVFVSRCPELMSPKHNGVIDIDGEAKYHITIHDGIDVRTNTFDSILEGLPHTTYVFVALGDDEENISAAIKLRSFFARMGYKPVIQAIVYNSDKKEALGGITNFKGESYDVDFIGDMKTSYSEDVILDSDVEEVALARHLRWGKESDFWQYDYNYKSSIASAIHKEMKIKCGIPGITKEKEDRTDEELWNIRKLEHCRWNAYMRSEGYVYSGSVQKSTRNDLAKMHYCLVPFYDLPYEEQIKDDD